MARLPGLRFGTGRILRDRSRKSGFIVRVPCRNIPTASTAKGWSWAAPDADVFGLDMRTPVDDQIEWLLRHKAPYLMTLPSNAMALAYAASREAARELGS